MQSAIKKLPSSLQAQQLEFASIAFPADRTVLYVGEVAARWRCTERHILDLLEEGSIQGFDIAGRFDYIRVPKTAIAQIAKLTNLPEATLYKIIQDTKPAKRAPRSHWRVLKEGYDEYITTNHSLFKL